ncbi:ADP-ribosyl-[dinitrogen reductase] hydrolase [Methyloprofundus sedimenti]|uniref:ADP-ribosyl-[dinitrogen reductase] hydrolase n=1 Tax=Methyloprofundus sedimenti TaxID=1420851 RepID=A0A1V8M1R9_9GAMM|nr:ADP-ribosyl-[dinitrogen reductase] hydrolase [Methyloprofundus sedimenti]OQK15509.1 ADP-ribosyl-[dinitrogen reductase] hydrolase [Methyloprofundus sedimenti]
MTTEPYLNHALSAYLGFACGDALGATVEFMSPKRIQKHYGVHKDIIGGGWLGLEAGQVTDDTQMSLALGQALIEHQGWNIAAVADNFVAWLDSDPPDIGDTCQRGILRYRDQGELFGSIRVDDAGNGACMRNLPVALATLNSPYYFTEWSLQQNHITHNNPLSDAATLSLGRMVQHLVKGGNLSDCQQEAAKLIWQYPEFGYTPYPGRASAYIVHTLQTVLHYFFTTDNFEDCLIATVNQGDDADTTGALVGMLAGARYGLASIPQRWLERLNKNVSEQIHIQSKKLLQLSKTFEPGGPNS